MLSQKLLDSLNEQIKYEFFSSHMYLAMAGYCYSIDLDGFANFFVVQAEEEKFHAMKIFNYVNDMDARVQITSLDDPENEYKDILDVFEKSLAHEGFVTDRIYKLMDIAQEEREHATISMLKWFVDEQVEEMSMFRTHVQKLKRAINDPSLLYAMDAELAQRTFVPPANA
ncbi:ferritin [Natranaerovirga pectinivora]|uniref:Ferritin n=1 Tax=Natranaerovirga pectinivora TaxID=682400 RepID=A0A4R3MIS1_9FIRM|nr:ferritin [Natranaerovirga pectinivora]TCT13770.1 ferritin [Natranaerovirga pectinivora]